MDAQQEQHLLRKINSAIERGDRAAASILEGQLTVQPYDDMQTAIDAEEPLLLSDPRPPQFEIVFDQATDRAHVIAVQ